MLKKYFWLAALVFSLAGCASVPMGDTKHDAELKTFSSKSASAGLYIYRNESAAPAIRMDVEVDGKTLGQTAAKTFFYTEVSPGKHTVTSISENTDTVEVDAVGGKLYYIWQEVKFGFLYARTKLHLVSDAEGQKGVLECQLAAQK
jgi:hypothetical protein